MHGPTCIFWANLTPFSHQVTIRNGTGVFLPAIKLPSGADPRARATIDVSEQGFAIAVYEQACTYRQIPGRSVPTCPSRDGPPKPAIGRTWALPVSWHGKDLQATIGLYQIVTLQYSSTTLYQVSYHIR
jgi:hypothetical protein